ncbi:hypothetical protein SUGI_1158600 [Cryptomeria japonica]|nr:hypothetical protein SUGI_1158600 [Cryptomeria japonica]
MLKSVAVTLVLCSLVPCAWGLACWDTCGNLQVKYPFGTGPGCGDPRFQSSQSGSFGLDWTAPFKLKNDVFVLLNCSASSSLYNPQSFLCDTGSAHICTSLYTCPGVQGLGIPQFSPITSCCVYTPVNLGSANEVNLAKLGCESYTSIYNFGDDTTDPLRWRYGIKLQYNYNLDNNNFPSACADCEKSNGICGFTSPYNSFVCVCKNGVNTTTDCYGQVSYFSRGTSNGSAATALWLTGFVLAIPSIWRFVLQFL